MITVKFFAQVRELVGTDSASIPADGVATIADVSAALCQIFPNWKTISADPMLMACNQDIVDAEHPVKAGDEIAFFPPVTGG